MQKDKEGESVPLIQKGENPLMKEFNLIQSGLLLTRPVLLPLP